MVSPSSITQHPLYSSLAVGGRRIAAKARQVPGRQWRLLCMVLVSAWAVHNLASGFWLLVPSPELEQPPLAPPPSSAAASAQSVDIDLAALQQFALFGEGGVAPGAEPERTVLPGIEQEAVDTSLKLRLQGVIASSDPDNAWAIISEGNDQALYKVGDDLPQGNNVSLVKVLEQRIILDNNGRYESLWLYSEEDAKRRTTASYDSSYDEQSGTANEEPNDEAYEEYVAEDGSADGGASEAEPEVHTLPASAEEEVKSISEVVRFTAARGDGGMMGYSVQPGRRGDLFAQAGLQPGDVVTTVNGISLDDPRQIRDVYQALQTASQAELSILRDGEPVSVNISLDSAR